MTDAETTADARLFRLSAAGLGLVLLAALIRVLTATEPFPYWATDPLQMTTPTTGLTPAMGLTLDAIALAGSALTLAGRRRHGPGLVELLLWACGAVVAALHASFIDHGSIENLSTGSAWITALASGLAARAIAGDRRLVSFAAATLLGATILLAGKGAVQVLIEHAQTVSAYRENREAFLAAEGWTAGSSMARAFERRLFQPESTGWFGLSNVYASVMAAAVIAMTGFVVAAWRSRSQVHPPLPFSRRTALTWTLIGGFAAAAGLALSQSKGGITAAIAGLAALAVSLTFRSLLQRRPRITTILVCAVPPAVLALVALRGALGERFGELSLHFRWFYIQGAGRIFSQSPLLGVGPGDFKEAYLLAKPPLSPEEVTSPHSIIFDYAATLGLGGIGWIAMMALWTFGIGRSLTQHAEATRDDLCPAVDRTELRWLLLLTAAAMLAGAWLEQPTATIEMTLVRFAGTGMWIAAAAAIMGVWRTPSATTLCRAGLACAAIALLAHAQIEVTPVWPGAAAWFMMIVGLAAGPAVITARPIARAASRWAGPVVLGVAALFTAFSSIGVWKWESSLAAAARDVGPAAEVRELLRQARTGTGGPEIRAALGSTLSALLGRPINTDPASLEAAARQVDRAALASATDHLAAAARAQPSHFGTARALSRVLIERAAAEPPAEAAALRQRADQTITGYLDRRPTSSPAWGWLGTLRAGLVEGDADGLRSACRAWEHAAALDPYSLEYAPDLARAYHTLGEADQARFWARRALENHDLHRLDPLQQLTAPDLELMQTLAEG